MWVDQKCSGVLFSPELGRAKENAAYDRYVKTKRQGAVWRTKALHHGACQFLLVSLMKDQTQHCF